MSATAAEKRRLQRILNDETYGPALVRLNRAQQREVLDLISEDRGREARQRILALDEQRRAARRTKLRTWRAWAQYLHDHVDQRMDVNQFVEWAEQNASTDDWAHALEALDQHTSADDIADQASRDATARLDYSPFWYHYYSF